MCLAWSATPEDTFSHGVAHIMDIKNNGTGKTLSKTSWWLNTIPNGLNCLQIYIVIFGNVKVDIF